MPHEALRKILPIADWSDDRAACVTFTGGTDPVLPTPFRIGTAGAATLAASGLAAAALWEDRTGRRQSVTVDLRQATASLRSGTYMKLGDGPLSHARNAHHGRLSHPRRTVELSALQFPQPPCRRARRARRRRGARGGGARRGALGRRRSRGGDHRGQGRRRHGAQPRRMGRPSAGGRHRGAAADGDRPHRRQSAREAAARRPPVARHPRARPHARACRADLRAAPSPSTAPTS